jgi:uncharacterized protein YbjT (DUF2867 family)
MYIIVGATGNTGRRISDKLLAAGKKVRVIGRSADKLKPLADKGAELAVGDINNTTFLEKAFEGGTALYVMIPPKMTAINFRKYQNAVSDLYLNAIMKSGIKNVVLLSSIGAHLTHGAGVVQGLYDFEQKLNKFDSVNCVYLRAGYFMENLFNSIGMIKSTGIFGTPLAPDAIIPCVATKDIADKAVEFLLDLNFKGKVIQYVLGPRDLTPVEQAKIIGKAIGKPDLAYVQFSYEDAEKSMSGMGMTMDVAKSMVQLMQSINEKLVYVPNLRTAENTTPTSLEEFAKTFSAVYKQS